MHPLFLAIKRAAELCAVQIQAALFRANCVSQAAALLLALKKDILPTHPRLKTLQRHNSRVQIRQESYMSHNSKVKIRRNLREPPPTSEQVQSLFTAHRMHPPQHPHKVNCIHWPQPPTCRLCCCCCMQPNTRTHFSIHRVFIAHIPPKI
eukprot:1161675-Pelagomonas_calceolata.AAC.3